MQNLLMSMREIMGERVSPKGATPTRTIEAAQRPKRRKEPKRGSFLTRKYMSASIAVTACPRMVATAAPAVPPSKTHTNT